MQGVINGASASGAPPVPTGTVRTQALQLCCNAVHVQRHARATSGCSAGCVSAVSLGAVLGLCGTHMEVARETMIITPATKR